MAVDETAFERYLKTDRFTWITCDSANTRRITRRVITKGWWCLHYREPRYDRHVLILSSAVDLERDIRGKIPGVVFELY